MTALRRSVFTALAGAMTAALLFSLATAYDARATHEPANKAAAAGSDLNEIDDAEPILSENFRVSSQEDMIVNVTSECSILTSLITGDDETFPTDPDGLPTGPSQDSAFAFGQVELFVTLDGKIVPVAVDDPAGPDPAANNDDPEEDQGDPQEQGEVVFCNRAYQRTVQDREPDEDEGAAEDDIDVERDYIRTRTANGFNWLAIDIGFVYDDACAGFDPAATPDPAFAGCIESVSNGNNVIEVKLWAEFESSDPAPQDPNKPGTEGCPTEPGSEIECTEAFVGSRTMILEPVKLSIHEAVEPHDTTPVTPTRGKGGN